MKAIYPEFYARFYDLIYNTQRDGVDNDFFHKEIKKTPGKILEVGVGTGRIFTQALNDGADIYGIDISQSMLDVLLKKTPAEHQHRISLQSIDDFSFDFKFDLIIAPFHMIMHLTEKEEQLRAIKNVYENLSINGRFIFDAFVPNLNQLITGIDNFTDFRTEYEPGKEVWRTISTKNDLIKQIINVKFRFDWDEDNEVKHAEWFTPMRYFFRFELEHLIERSGFESYKILGDYLGNELNSDSKEFIAVCERHLRL